MAAAMSRRVTMSSEEAGRVDASTPGRCLSASTARLTSAISIASAVRAAHTAASTAADGPNPAGAPTAGRARIPAPIVDPRMRATADTTLASPAGRKSSREGKPAPRGMRGEAGGDGEREGGVRLTATAAETSREEDEDGEREREEGRREEREVGVACVGRPRVDDAKERVSGANCGGVRGRPSTRMLA